VVLTYNEKGFYGHPDHIAVNRITLAAMEASGSPAQFPETGLPPWLPARLYYTAAPRSRFVKMKEHLEQRGQRFDWDVDFLATPDDQVTAWIDVHPFVAQKLRAIYSHRSQVGPKSFVSRLHEPLRTEVLGTECYVCVTGCEGLSRHEDLFHGLRA